MCTHKNAKSMKQAPEPCMWHLSNCFWPHSSSRHLTFGISCGRLGHNTAQKSLSFNWLFCFRWRANCQQKQILLILTKLQNMEGNGQCQFFWRANNVVHNKTCISRPHNTLPLPLRTSTNTHQISLSISSRFHHPERVKFHTHFSQHIF